MSYLKNRAYNTRTNKSFVETPADNILIVVVIFIVVFGIMAVFSASAPKAIAQGENPISFVIKQVAWLVIGIFRAGFFAKFDYKRLKHWASPLAITVLVTLLLVQFSPLGVTVNEAKRWLVIGPLQFQPSELAKPAVVLYFATLFSRNCTIIDSKKYPFYFIFGLMLLLIYKQPNLSMIILLLVTSVAMFYVAGGSLKLILGTGAVGLLGVVSTIRDYQLQRIKVWLNPFSDALGAGYNIIQSLVAFSSGGIFGVGFGNSKQKLAWLPEGHTDFIFTSFTTSFGIVGALILLLIIFLFNLKLVKDINDSKNMREKLIISGFLGIVLFQQLYNISMTIGLVPIMGITLPFLSDGGSSLISCMILIGIIISLGKKNEKQYKINYYY